ncbi:hypothetical protein N7471_009104 [Penicillium samsonianum]|uniref:uncharacterized protein n=1 Tax=Penicillium samsonianum TaxID=1882272 RepID=UPI002548BDE8|nr:uncharacterized protein N7471_009104 [Penicillium samsonianum]KAJ6127887.1 hypothetical protein N7471_009104 [Penicillium samsonianum]
MARFPVVFVLFALLAAPLVTAFNQTLELENSNCDNNCYFDSFPGGSCTNDAACMCDKQQYREAYFCCMKDCNPNVMPDSITRQHRECKARNMDFTFDAEARCGVKLTKSDGFLVAAATTTSTTTSTTTAGDPTTTGDSKSSTASASTTSAASLTASQEASSTGSQTSSGSSTPTPTNGTSGKGAICNIAMIIVAVAAVVLF